MNEPRRERRIRRITVTLGGRSSEARALRAVAALARASAAELAGLFMVDTELLRLAELPFAIEICRTTSVQRRVEPAELEHQLRVQALEAERALARTAEEAGVAWSFRVARDTPVATVLAAAAETDLVALAARRVSWIHERASEPEAEEPARAAAPLVVVFDRSAAALRALDVGARLAEAEGAPLSVVIAAASQESGARLRERAEETLGERSARFRTLIRPKVGRLIEAARDERPRMVILPAAKRLLESGAVRALLEGFDCASLLVR